MPTDKRVKRKPLVVTLKWLAEHRACQGSLELFLGVFGESAELTLANLKKAGANGMNVWWLAELLSDTEPRLQARFKKALSTRTWSDFNANYAPGIAWGYLKGLKVLKCAQRA